MTRARRSEGFTLIEVLVAFVIAASSLALLFRIQANATTATILAQEYLHGTQLAQSLSAELPVTEGSAAFAKSGLAEGKYDWIVRSEPYDTRTAGDGDLRRVSLRTVTVDVKWRSRDGSRSIELRTVKPFYERIDE